MKKDSILSHIVWCLYTLTVGAAFCTYMVKLALYAEFGLSIGIVFSLVLLVFSGLLTKRLRRMYLESRAVREGEQTPFLQKWELPIVFFLFVLLIGVRISYSATDTDYRIFYMAKVTEGNFSPAVSQGATWIYVHLVHELLALFGNHIIVLKYVQLVLCVAAALSVYHAVKQMSGVIGATSVLLLMSVCPYFVSESMKATPLMLCLIVYGLAIRLIPNIRKRRSIFGAMGRYVITGVLLGFSVFLDLTGLTLIFFLIGAIWFYSKMGYEAIWEKFPDFWNSKTVAFLASLLVGILCFLGIHVGKGLLEGDSITESMGRQLSKLITFGFQLPEELKELKMGEVFPGLWLILFLLTIGIFSFWYQREMRQRSGWLLAIIAIVVMQCFGMFAVDEVNPFAVAFLFCIAMSSHGLSDLVYRPAKTTEDTTPGYYAASSDLGEEFLAVDRGRTEGQTDSSGAEKTQTAPVSASDDIEFIENPLPLPKKHEKKVMDYDYPVADDDDFDIP